MPGIITAVGPRAGASGPPADAVIDGTGKYVMPGMVNTHMHWHEERAPGVPQPIQYERNLYLASGVTTARELGGNLAKTKRWQKESNDHAIVSPRIIAFTRPSMGKLQTPDEIRQGVRDAKAAGADGLKLMFLDRDQLEIVMSEAKALGLPTTTHIGVEETTAKDYIELGVTSIEHFYGIGDAALDGIQNFPPDMNYSNEFHRFARAGELYAQANPDKLRAVVELMASQGRRLEPDAVDLRSQPRRDPRAEPALVPRLSAPVDGAVLEAESRQPRLVLRRVGQHAGSALAPELPHLDGCAAALRPARAA